MFATRVVVSHHWTLEDPRVRRQQNNFVIYNKKYKLLSSQVTVVQIRSCVNFGCVFVGIRTATTAGLKLA